MTESAAFELVRLRIARHWEASARHGMPVRTDGFRLFTAETTSTCPAWCWDRAR